MVFKPKYPLYDFYTHCAAHQGPFLEHTCPTRTQICLVSSQEKNVNQSVLSLKAVQIQFGHTVHGMRIIDIWFMLQSKNGKIIGKSHACWDLHIFLTDACLLDVSNLWPLRNQCWKDDFMIPFRDHKTHNGLTTDGETVDSPYLKNTLIWHLESRKRSVRWI